jgi:hypothetical protein
MTYLYSQYSRLRQEEHEFKDNLGYTAKACLKKTKKGTAEVTQVVQWLPSKCKALSSNPKSFDPGCP